MYIHVYILELLHLKKTRAISSRPVLVFTCVKASIYIATTTAIAMQ
jgi:hypothetical protein